MSDIDRIFIATNVELEDQEANDDRSLCRFEFFEIIVRIAKTKFLETQICPTLPKALQKLISEHIIGKADYIKQEGFAWRQDKLWQIEINDLYEAN